MKAPSTKAAKDLAESDKSRGIVHVFDLIRVTVWMCSSSFSVSPQSSHVPNRIVARETPGVAILSDQCKNVVR